MWKIDRDARYSMADVEREFSALGMDTRTFLDECCPKKIFRSVWRGADLLESLDDYAARRDEQRRVERFGRVGHRRPYRSRREREPEILAMPKK